MIGLSNRVVDGWLRIVEMRGSLESESQIDEDTISSLREELKNLAEEVSDSSTSIGSGQTGISCSLKDLDIDKPLSADVKQDLLRKCDELRLQFLLLLIATRKIAGGDESGEELIELIETRDPFATATIVYEPGGLVYSKFSETIAILVPMVNSLEHCDLILKDFVSIFEQGKSDDTWVVDFSGVKKLPLPLVGTLIGYARWSSSRNISFCWLRDGALPDYFMERVAKIFKCKKIGDHWFTFAEE